MNFDRTLMIIVGSLQYTFEECNNFPNQNYHMHVKVKIDIQCLPLSRITLGQRKSDNNNRMIQLIERNGGSTIMEPALFDYNMRLIQLSVIYLSGGHCSTG